MGNDQSGNLYTNNLYINGNIAIDNNHNYTGNFADFKKINVNGKKFVDSSKNIVANNIICERLNTHEIKSNSKTIIDSSANLFAQNINANGTLYSAKLICPIVDSQEKLPTQNLIPGEMYFDTANGNYYIYQNTIDGTHYWSVFNKSSETKS